MKKSELVEYIKSPEFTFKIQRIGVEFALRYKGIRLNPERFMTTLIESKKGEVAFRILLDVATQEEELISIPANWWQALKERVLPKRLKWWFPVRCKEVWAYHKFPELGFPEEVVGREFVHLQVIDQDKLMKKGRENEEHKEL